MSTERTAGRMTTERTARSPLRGLIGFNLLTGILLGIVGVGSLIVARRPETS